MDVAEDHKSRKLDRHWSNLVAGETGIYKAEAIDELVSLHLKTQCEAILDVGCGTSVIATELRDRLGARRLVFMDYDEAITNEMREQTADQTIEWAVDDIFKVGDWTDRFDLVLLLDMIHEVYSFYGRHVHDLKSEIDHELGLEHIRKALGQVAALVNPGGGIVITDNVLSPEDKPIVVRARNEKTVETLKRFFAEYPSRRMKIDWLDETSFRIRSHDFNIVTTQYNKIKSGQEDRWNVEQFEIHQYMTERQLSEAFATLGFTMHAIVGTPDDAKREWSEDFQVLEGLDALPDKRISLIAIRDR